MAYYSTSGRDPSQHSSLFDGLLAPPVEPAGQSPTETDLAALRAKLAGATGLSPQLSADLALEIVLHEIAEQACQATGATGAAIALERDGEMVCRATSGPTAPQLGVRMDDASGLSGECMRTRQALRCDDAVLDPRVDVEASQRLGVRSVMVLPILRIDGNNTTIIGILEAFSSRPAAFGERDQYTLEVLAVRVLKTLDRALMPAADEPANSEVNTIVPDSGADPHFEVDQHASTKLSHSKDIRALDILTGGLAATVLVTAVWLGVRVVQHLGSSRSAGRGHGVKVASVDAVAKGPAQPQSERSAAAAGGSLSASTSTSALSSAAPAPVRQPPAVQAPDTSAPEGSLRVYDNGKEVFRMPASSGVEQGGDPASGISTQQASALGSQAVVALSPAVAEGNLIHRVEPEYPEAARQQKIQGAVVLEARIRPDGAVEEVQLISGQPLLAEAAMAAVKQWRFKARSAKGDSAEMQTTITLKFRLPR